MTKKDNKDVQFIHCPNCKQAVAWSNQSLYRPFCSNRCKMIDLGEWLDETNTISGDPYLGDEDIH